ncbi:hypothetical protein [Flavobacterium sp. '19STA2R22 D10 B1']|uniref:hypothetical protein n=1 Tax=Flavobacterium aerium TaxID=3037261 RepID=UPI00278BE325|nr:hypothetical protein [Flavobacterium sp. '19STA2R22 D10 B1']
MKKIVLIFSISFLTFSCVNQNFEFNEKYLKDRSEFEASLINFFPKKIMTNPAKVISSKDLSKNDVAIMVYEYNADPKVVDSVINYMEKKKVVKYNSRNSCLLIVNGFETIETYENIEKAIIKDSTQINKECYKGLLPIPNFINYNYPNKKNELKLDGNFDIYVLEAKSGNHFKEFDLQPNPQMPSEWKNGYSKGIAVSKEKHTIIYWSIIW